MVEIGHGQGVERDRPRLTGVVDQDVDRPDVAGDLPGHLGDLRGVGDIGTVPDEHAAPWPRPACAVSAASSARSR